MTTPNQPKPDWGQQFADLSYEIGGGLWNYGQDITDDVVRWLVYGEIPTPDNMWDMMKTNLLKMPLEVLQHWCPFIPGTTIENDFDTVEKSVDTILDYFPKIPKLLKIEEWQKWLAEVFGPFYDDVTNFINDSLAWLNDTFTPFFNDVGQFIEDTLAWIEQVFKPLEALVDEIGQLAQDAWDFAGGIVDALIQGFHGWGSNVVGHTLADLRKMGSDLGVLIGELNAVVMRVQQLEQGAATALENFSTYVQNAASLPANLWNQVYSGTGGALLGTQQGFAVLVPTPDTVNKVAVAVTKAVTETDFQTVSAVISKPITDAASSVNTILARVDPNAPLTTNVFAKLTDTTAAIGYTVNGVETILQTVPNTLVNGATYTLQAGVGAAANTFQLLQNQKPVFPNPVTDALNQSAVGAAVRSAGFGVVAPNATARPGVVAAFSVFGKK